MSTSLTRFAWLALVVGAVDGGRHRRHRVLDRQLPARLECALSLPRDALLPLLITVV
jgi:hypothetical protein